MPQTTRHDSSKGEREERGRGGSTSDLAYELELSYALDMSRINDVMRAYHGIPDLHFSLIAVCCVQLNQITNVSCLMYIYIRTHTHTHISLGTVFTYHIYCSYIRYSSSINSIIQTFLSIINIKI